MYRGAVASASRGARGQKFFRDLLAALDEMPDKYLIADSFKSDGGGYCALGALGAKRGIDLDPIDPEDLPQLASTLKIASALAAETMYQNDDDGPYYETPEKRWQRMRAWVAGNIKP